MKLRLITVSLDPTTGEFPPEPLSGVEVEVVSVVEHFFHHQGMPHLRLLEERTAQRAGGEPQQVATLQPQRQPGLSRGELNAGGGGLVSGHLSGPVGTGLRSGTLRPGVDPSPVLSFGALAGLRSSETEAPPPGGGAPGVAAGHFSRGKR